MRIEHIALKNYRQFKDVELNFEDNPTNDLSIIIGQNGTGKTNLLNAINWCFYGDEPHLSKESQQVPVLNLVSVGKAEAERCKMSVRIRARTTDGQAITFAREQIFTVHKGERYPSLHESLFQAEVEGARGNTDILENEEADAYVERFVPKRIREFFFFDGERLDRYFKEATGQNIKHAIFDISQIDLLERMEDRLQSLLSDLRKQAGKQNPKIEKARSDLEAAQNGRREVQESREEAEHQIRIAKENIEEYQDKLRGIPDVEGLAEERERLKAEKDRKNKFFEDKVKAKNDLVFEYFLTLSLWPAIEEALALVRQKKSLGEIPPTIDKALLESIIEEERCSICDRALDDDSAGHVKSVLEGLRVSSAIAQELMSMEAPLLMIEDEVKAYEKRITSVSKEANSYEMELERIEQRLIDIGKSLSGYDEEDIRDWHNELKNFEKILEINLKDLALLEEKDKRLFRVEETMQKILDDELKKEGRAKELGRQIGFCKTALETVSESKLSIMSDTKNRIQEKTKELFSDLLWKKTTFGDVIIGDDYNINLIHSMGYECLGTVGAAERELLALSFTLALHDVSGFASPILIDTPVARISDTHRKKFGEVLSSIGKDKQIILLFTPSEYSSEISKLLDHNSSHRYRLRMKSDEKETVAERL